MAGIDRLDDFGLARPEQDGFAFEGRNLGDRLDDRTLEGAFREASSF